jgi:hypothetical protein
MVTPVPGAKQTPVGARDLGYTEMHWEIDAICKCTYDGWLKDDYYLDFLKVDFQIKIKINMHLKGDRKIFAEKSELDHEADFKEWAKNEGRKSAQQVENKQRKIRYGTKAKCENTAKILLQAALLKSGAAAVEKSHDEWDGPGKPHEYKP